MSHDCFAFLDERMISSGNIFQLSEKEYHNIPCSHYMDEVLRIYVKYHISLENSFLKNEYYFQDNPF